MTFDLKIVIQCNFKATFYNICLRISYSFFLLQFLNKKWNKQKYVQQSSGYNILSYPGIIKCYNINIHKKVTRIHRSYWRGKRWFWYRWKLFSKESLFKKRYQRIFLIFLLKIELPLKYVYFFHQNVRHNIEEHLFCYCQA